MAYDGWIEFGGVEIVNLSRTAQLAQALGISTVWTRPEDVQWIQDDLGGVDYDDITKAPWYDAGYAASAEFAGCVPLSFSGLDDSTLTSTPIEYINDGGHSGRPRNATLPMVANFVLVGTTARGVEYGKRWLDRVLRGSGGSLSCSGSELRYFRYNEEDSPQAHRRDVRTTRGTSITRKHATACDALWTLTFTVTAADPFEYGDPLDCITKLGPTGISGPKVTSSGTLVMIQSVCPEYDYAPIYDPLYPALVAGPAVPDFYPAGWDIFPGMNVERFWARLSLVEPLLNVVPLITLSTPTDARMVKVSIWSGDSANDIQCGPLFSTVVSYAPAAQDFTIDGEQKVAYVWDGVSPVVNRADSLIYSPEASPVDWTSFNDEDGLLVTIDLYSESSSDDLAHNAQIALSLISKSN